jgi:hypothetical protein
VTAGGDVTIGGVGGGSVTAGAVGAGGVGLVGAGAAGVVGAGAAGRGTVAAEVGATGGGGGGDGGDGGDGATAAAGGGSAAAGGGASAADGRFVASTPGATRRAGTVGARSSAVISTGARGAASDVGGVPTGDETVVVGRTVVVMGVVVEVAGGRSAPTGIVVDDDVVVVWTLDLGLASPRSPNQWPPRAVIPMAAIASQPMAAPPMLISLVVLRAGGIRTSRDRASPSLRYARSITRSTAPRRGGR